MSRFPGVKRILHFAFGRRGLAREIDEEMAFHLESTIAELEAGGMSATEARAEAERRFGNLPEYRTALTALGQSRRNDEQRREYLDILRQHLTYAWRGIVKRPGFALTIALTLALGIGANAVMFGVIDRLLFRAPEQIVDPGGIRRVFIERAQEQGKWSYPYMSYPDAVDLEHATTIANVASYESYKMEFGTDRNPDRLPATLVSPGFFRLLGTRPALGRLFEPGDDSASADNAVVVLGYNLWRRQFNRDRNVLGRSLRIDGHLYSVVGVTPQGFTGAELEPVDLWLPLGPASDAGKRTTRWRTERGWAELSVIIRPVAGASDQALSTEMLALQRPYASEKDPGERWQRIRLASLVAADSPNRPSEIPVAIWLACTSLALLIIATANVATLLLSRAVQRRRELAVRLALGVSRGRLVGQLMVESLVTAAVGGAGALATTAFGSSLLWALLLPEIARPASVLDIRVILFVVVVTLVTGSLASIIPAWLESRPDLLSALKAGTPGGGVRRSRAQGFLVLAQSAMSVGLLVGAGLFVLSLARVRSIDIGMDSNAILTAIPVFPDNLDHASRALATRAGLEAIQRLPMMEHAALSIAKPFAANWTARVRAQGSPDKMPTADLNGAYFNMVSPEYFAAMGTRLLRGRLFSGADAAGGPPVGIVSQRLGDILWPNRDPLGQCFRESRHSADSLPCTTVIGVVADAKWSDILAPDTYSFYYPIAQMKDPIDPILVMRPRAAPRDFVQPLRSSLQSAMPTARYVNVELLQDSIDPQTRSWRLGATLFLVFGALALVVAAIGLYSVMACRVAQRKHELGVRTALGASWRDLIQMVVREGVGLVSGGIVIGLLIALAAAPAVAPLLYHTSPRDPEVMLVVTGVLLLSAAIACAIPAWRASRVDPLEALKAE
ncbi:MAG: ADOP family duplicated permease [Gemmatimonadota bacterium]